MKHLLASLCLLLLVAGCDRASQPAAPAPEPSASPATGSTAAKIATPTPAPAAAPAKPGLPTLRVATVDGQPFDLATHRGHWVVVNFWATWCAPCLKEMPDLSALDAMREHIDVIGLDYEDITPGDLQAFLKKHPVVYPVAIVDVYKPPADFATPRGLPTTYLIAPDGKVAKHFLGPITARDVDDAIAEAGGPKPAA